MIYQSLLYEFLIIGLVSFGGGYAALPFIQDRVIARGWMTLQQVIDVTTISQMTPGPIGVNVATFVGMQIAGLGGAAVATLGFVLPSVFIVLALAYFYFKYRSLRVVQGALTGIQPAVAALIAMATWNIAKEALWGDLPVSLSGTNLIAVAIAAVMLVVLAKTRLGPISVIVFSGVVGLVVYGVVGI